MHSSFRLSLLLLIATVTKAQQPLTAEEMLAQYPGEARIRSSFFGPRFYVGNQRVDYRRFSRVLQTSGGFAAEEAKASERYRRRSNRLGFAGDVAMLGSFVAFERSNSRSHRYSNRHPTFGLVLMGVGIGLGTTGCVYHLKSRSALRRSVSFYNRGRSRDTGLYLGSTSQGFGLVMKW